MSLPIKTTAPPDAHTRDSAPRMPMLALVIAGCKKEPWRIGELAFYPPDQVRWLGRGRLPIEEYSSFDKHRPGDPFPPQLGISGCLQGDSLSRRQAKMTGRGAEMEIENLEACPMFVNGVETSHAIVRPGDVVTFGTEVVFLCVLRLPEFPPLRHTKIAHAFGDPDADGIVGEAPEAWRVRDEAVYVGRGSDDVIILGETGAGKTAIAKLLHGVSSRAHGPFYERNCSNFNEGILPTELFGKIANFPTPGPAMLGAFPAAEGGSLFLDEVGLLSHDAQGQLLVVLEKGSYYVVGESKMRRVDVRVIAATNRPRSALKPDFQFRIAASIRVTPLRDRREDIPLLVRAMLRLRLAKDPSLMRLFSKGPSGELHPRISFRLLEFLLRHDLPGNAREVDLILAAALANSHKSQVEMLPAGSPELSEAPSASAPRSSTPSASPSASVPRSAVPSTPRPASAPRSAPPSTERDVQDGEDPVTVEKIQAAYEKARGNHSEAARLLGFERNKLYRIMRELGMETPEK